MEENMLIYFATVAKDFVLNNVSRQILTEAAKASFVTAVLAISGAALYYLACLAKGQMVSTTASAPAPRGDGEADFAAWRAGLSAAPSRVTLASATALQHSHDRLPDLAAGANGSDASLHAAFGPNGSIHDLRDHAGVPPVPPKNDVETPRVKTAEEHHHGLTCSHGPFGGLVRFAKTVTHRGSHTHGVATAAADGASVVAAQH